MSFATDIFTKVGGTLALIGLFAGAWLNSSTTCTSSFRGGRSCTNVFGEVELTAGQPNTVELMLTGAFVGALAGAAIGIVVSLIWPQHQEDLGVPEI